MSASQIAPPAVALHELHRVRLRLAAQVMVMKGQDITFMREDGVEGTRQMVWYDGPVRRVILSGEGAAFDRLYEAARREFIALMQIELRGATA